MGYGCRVTAHRLARAALAVAAALAGSAAVASPAAAGASETTVRLHESYDNLVTITNPCNGDTFSLLGDLDVFYHYGFLPDGTEIDSSNAVIRGNGVGDISGAAYRFVAVGSTNVRVDWSTGGVYEGFKVQGDQHVIAQGSVPDFFLHVVVVSNGDGSSPTVQISDESCTP